MYPFRKYAELGVRYEPKGLSFNEIRYRAVLFYLNVQDYLSEFEYGVCKGIECKTKVALHESHVSIYIYHASPDINVLSDLISSLKILSDNINSLKIRDTIYNRQIYQADMKYDLVIKTSSDIMDLDQEGGLKIISSCELKEAILDLSDQHFDPIIPEEIFRIPFCGDEPQNMPTRGCIQFRIKSNNNRHAHLALVDIYLSSIFNMNRLSIGSNVQLSAAYISDILLLNIFGYFDGSSKQKDRFIDEVWKNITLPVTPRSGLTDNYYLRAQCKQADMMSMLDYGFVTSSVKVPHGSRLEIEKVEIKEEYFDN